MTNILPRPRRRNMRGPAALLAGALLLMALPVIAAMPPPVIPTPTVLQVLPLRDAGGLPEEGGKAPLNAQLTQGLAKYLADTAGGRVLIVDAQMRAVSGKGQPGPRGKRGGGKPEFTLEGELSHVQTGAADGGAYFCVLRLFEQRSSDGSSVRRLRHQWAGMAQTYLDLTSNLRHDGRVDPEGLLGGLAKSVLADVSTLPASDQVKQFAAFVATASAFKRVTAQVVPEAAPIAAAEQPPLQSGDRYRLKVMSQDRGSVYLVALDSSGQPSGLFLPDSGQEIEVDADRPALVPGETPLQTGLVTAATDHQIIVLVRRSQKAAAQDAPTASLLHLANLYLRDTSADTTTPGTSAAVQILDSAPAISAPPAPDDPGIARLLHMAASDPAGTWLAQTVTVHIVPKKDLMR